MGKPEIWGNTEKAAQARRISHEKTKMDVPFQEAERAAVTAGERSGVESVIVEADEKKRADKAFELTNMLEKIGFPPESLEAEVTEEEQRAKLNAIVEQYLQAVQDLDNPKKTQLLQELKQLLG